MESIPNILLILLGILIAPLALLLGGICVLYLTGCCIAGSIMLCYHLHKDVLMPIWHIIVRHRKAITLSIITILGTGLLAFAAKDLYMQAITHLDIKGQLTDDFIEVVTSVAIGTIISIMTIALPIIISTMHNLADRYQTNYVLSVMNRDWTLVLFRILLLASLEISVAWIVCFFHAPESLCSIAILLFVFALLLTLSLIILVARMVYFSMPDKLFQIIKSKLINLEVPIEYYDLSVLTPGQYKYGSKQENERQKKLRKIDEYDSEQTRLYVIIVRIFVLFGNDKTLRKDIFAFWKEICKNAPKIEKNHIKRYTESYYNFIYELADWAIGHNDVRLQEEAISVMGLLLNAHLGEDLHYGEIETAEHRKKYILSMETLECMWKTMRKSVDSQSDDMFKKYWQIVNNFFSRKFDERGSQELTDEEILAQTNESNLYLIIHYLCCSYLIGRKKYNLIEYTLYYSQQSNFQWYLLPNDINDVLLTYFLVKGWYAKWENREHFSFTEDYNLFSEIKTSNPIAQFTVLLLLFVSQDADEIRNVKVEEKHQAYLKQLCNMLNYIDETTDWVRYLHMEALLKKKDEILLHLESLLSANASSADSLKFTRYSKQNTICQSNLTGKIVKFIREAWSCIKNKYF